MLSWTLLKPSFTFHLFQRVNCIHSSGRFQVLSIFEVRILFSNWTIWLPYYLPHKETCAGLNLKIARFILFVEHKRSSRKTNRAISVTSIKKSQRYFYIRFLRIKYAPTILKVSFLSWNDSTPVFWTRKEPSSSRKISRKNGFSEKDLWKKNLSVGIMPSSQWLAYFANPCLSLCQKCVPIMKVNTYQPPNFFKQRNYTICKLRSLLKWCASL